MALRCDCNGIAQPAHSRANVSPGVRRGTQRRSVSIRRTLAVLGVATFILIGSTTGVLAGAGNPARTGQPGAECGDEGATLEPAGFQTDGFATAESRYAGSDGTASLANANSDHAVSQYDIACVHYTASH